MCRVYLSSDPREYARRVIREVGIKSPPVPVEPILKYFGLNIQAITQEEISRFGSDLLSSDRINSLLVRESTSATIFVLSNMIRQRRRMSVFHEIAHFDLPWHEGSSFFCDDLEWKGHRPAIEREAFRYAAEMMMPLEFTTDFIHNADPTINNLVQFAAEYDVSFESAALNYVHYSRRPCAIICVESNPKFQLTGKPYRLRYVVRSKRFPGFHLRQREIGGGGLIGDFLNAGGPNTGKISAREISIDQSWAAHCELKHHGRGRALGILSLTDSQIGCDDNLEVDHEGRIIRPSFLRKAS